MILRRKEAIILSSFFKFLSFSEEELRSIAEYALAEISLEINEATPEVANYYARKSIEHRFGYFKNDYLQTFLSNQLGRAIEVNGGSRRLIPCLCCGYKTIERRGEYDVCKVCFWEDDGNSDLSEYSNVNKLTLLEAKENFKKLGVMEDGCQEFVDPDRMIQFEKTV